MEKIIPQEVLKPELTIMCGLPLSGKSTRARSLQRGGKVVVCPDTVRLALHGKEYVQNAEPFVWSTIMLGVRALLMDGHRVVIDAVNGSISRRQPWVDMATEFDIPLRVMHIATPESVCIQRARDAGREHMISVIERMSKTFEPPTKEEGLILVSAS